MSFGVAVVILVGAAVLAGAILGGAHLIVRRLGPRCPASPAVHPSSNGGPTPEQRTELARTRSA